MEKYFSIAIDGPSGAGKSSIAKALAQSLQFIYVDTGAIYRTVGLAANRRGLDCKSSEQITPILDQIKVELKYIEGTQHMFLDGEDVSTDIRMTEISKCASDVSALPEVRSFLLAFQRQFAENNNVIMDGRDIGTVVLPNADVKIFLTCSAESRAMRRVEENREKGIPCSYEEILENINYRDKQDSSRSTAPLKAAEDAILVDNSNLSFEDELEYILKIVEERRTA